MHANRLGLIALLLLCVACNDDVADDDSNSTRCDSISGGNSSVSTEGPVSNAGAAVDNDLESFASLNLSTASRTASIRATAQEGVAYPAGARAGAFVTMRNQGSSNATTVRLFMEGTLVEQSNITNSINDPTAEGTAAERYVGLTSSVTFDAVELVQTDNGSSVTPTYQVHEICSDGAVQ